MLKCKHNCEQGVLFLIDQALNKYLEPSKYSPTHVKDIPGVGIICDEDCRYKTEIILGIKQCFFPHFNVVSAQNCW